MADTDEGAGSHRPRDRAWSFLELLALTGLAVAEPILSAFRDDAAVFVLRRASGLDIVGWTLVVVLAPAVALWLFEQAVSLVRPALVPTVHNGLLGFLVVIVVIRAGYSLASPARALILIIAIAAGAVAAVAFTRWPPLRSWLRVLSVFPLVLALVFVGTEPVASLVIGGEDDGVGEATIGNPVPVVLLVLDEFPTASILDDRNEISASQFPNLARLAEDATWFRNHSAVAPSTPQAVPSVLTGRYPESLDTLPVAETQPDNLFTLLRGGYVENVRESATRLCPTSVCGDGGGVEQGNPIAALLDDAGRLFSDQLAADDDERRGDFEVRQSDPNAPINFAEFLDSLSTGRRPRLDFHHAIYPHQPWFHLPDGRTYEAPFVANGLVTDGYTWADAGVADAGRSRHLLQARHADHLVGQLLDRLEQIGTYDDALVIVTADHGVAFTAGEPIRGLSSGNEAEVMWTPLLMKEPGQTEGRLDERPVQSVDLLPTIADVLDVELPFEVDGSSALGPASTSAEPDDVRRFFEWRLNVLQPDGDDGLIEVDGSAGYADLLAAPPPGGGDGTEPDLAFYRAGRHGDLVGLTPEEVGIGSRSAHRVGLYESDNYESVDLARSPVPAYVSGIIDAEEQVDVAVSVNGRIGGWGESFDTRDEVDDEWWTLIPPQFLRNGDNQLELWEIETDDDGSRLLRPLT